VKPNLQLDDLQVFCVAARRASFAGAATELGMSPAWVSKRIAALEASLQCRLFLRSARRVTVTEDGERVYAVARQLLQEVDGVFEAASARGLEPRGSLRISTSFRFGRLYLGPLLSRLAQRHPALDITLDVVDHRVDLLRDGLDLDVRIGEQVEEPHLVAHRLADSSRLLCAAPAYLARRGEPAAVADLAGHDCLVLRDRAQAFGVWQLQGPQGSLEKVKVTGRLASNNAEVVRGWALDGHGLLLQAHWDLADDLRAGRLQRVLPGHLQPASLWAVSTPRSATSAKVRACVAFLREALATGPMAFPALPG
jgi:LysR family transcriptional activator of dmlA